MGTRYGAYDSLESFSNVYLNIFTIDLKHAHRKLSSMSIIHVRTNDWTGCSSICSNNIFHHQKNMFYPRNVMNCKFLIHMLNVSISYFTNLHTLLETALKEVILASVSYRYSCQCIISIRIVLNKYFTKFCVSGNWLYIFKTNKIYLGWINTFIL